MRHTRALEEARDEELARAVEIAKTPLCAPAEPVPVPSDHKQEFTMLRRTWQTVDVYRYQVLTHTSEVAVCACGLTLVHPEPE